MNVPDARIDRGTAVCKADTLPTELPRPCQILIIYLAVHDLPRQIIKCRNGRNTHIYDETRSILGKPISYNMKASMKE